MRCPCGYTKFDSAVRLSAEREATRWVPASPDIRTGMGSTELGVTAGFGTAGWGSVVRDVVTGTLETRCLSCGRARSQRGIGGGTVLAAWFGEGEIFALMSDVVDPACMSARFQSVDDGAFTSLAERRVDVTIDVVEVPVPAIAFEAEHSSYLPAGAVVGDRVYRVALPDNLTGAYDLLFLDRCLRITQFVARIEGGIQTVFGRSGDVVAMTGDYAASQVLMDDTTSIADHINAIKAVIDNGVVPSPASDLAGDGPGEVVGAVRALQGRPLVSIVDTVDFVFLPWEAIAETFISCPLLRWSEVNQRWEIG